MNDIRCTHSKEALITNYIPLFYMAVFTKNLFHLYLMLSIFRIDGSITTRMRRIKSSPQTSGWKRLSSSLSWPGLPKVKDYRHRFPLRAVTPIKTAFMPLLKLTLKADKSSMKLPEFPHKCKEATLAKSGDSNCESRKLKHQAREMK
ncbi:hypothetical protein ElyMa_002589600 [Elysia marginata]|uniref:Uncharacterized protein n=1 Tax=Elysia marginata TaxID=1093978 RepID=A0AAV4GZY1_9GAST|nr:hypothetical protein ElyMa_002589600 [Elysia marginata]